MNKTFKLYPQTSMEKVPKKFHVKTKTLPFHDIGDDSFPKQLKTITFSPPLLSDMNNIATLTTRNQKRCIRF